MNRWRRTSLGTRLALAIGVLTLVVFAIVGVVLINRTKHILEVQFDAQITKSQAMWAAKPKYQLPAQAGWYSATYAVSNGKATLQNSSQDLPDPEEFARVAEKVVGHNEYFETMSLRDEGTFRLRACPADRGQVLVTAAPFDEIDNTVNRVALVLAGTFLGALIVLVVAGRFVLRRGLRPLSDMAETAHDITSHDLTDSAHLPVRAGGSGGGPEVEELRTSFNVMLDHIDQSLAARTAAEQRLRRFIADASHELRTPLTSIRGYADLFQYAAANEPEEREAHLSKIRAETERMSVLVDDLLLLARLDAESPLRIEQVNLVEIASAAAEAFVAAHPDHPLDFDAPSNVPTLGDPMRLRQVVDNLLTNIARHTPPGTSVELKVALPAVVTITDTGPGIAAEHQSRIFDRFYRVDDSRSRNIGGTGLGLAIVHSIISAHGGTVSLNSQPGRTTFTLSLPPM